MNTSLLYALLTFGWLCTAPINAMGDGRESLESSSSSFFNFDPFSKKSNFIGRGLRRALKDIGYTPMLQQISGAEDDKQAEENKRIAQTFLKIANEPSRIFEYDNQKQLLDRISAATAMALHYAEEFRKFRLTTPKTKEMAFAMWTKLDEARRLLEINNDNNLYLSSAIAKILQDEVDRANTAMSNCTSLGTSAFSKSLPSIASAPAPASNPTTNSLIKKTPPSSPSTTRSTAASLIAAQEASEIQKENNQNPQEQTDGSQSPNNNNQPLTQS